MYGKLRALLSGEFGVPQLRREGIASHLLMCVVPHGTSLKELVRGRVSASENYKESIIPIGGITTPGLGKLPAIQITATTNAFTLAPYLQASSDYAHKTYVTIGANVAQDYNPIGLFLRNDWHGDMSSLRIDYGYYGYGGILTNGGTSGDGTLGNNGELANRAQFFGLNIGSSAVENYLFSGRFKTGNGGSWLPSVQSGYDLYTRVVPHLLSLFCIFDIKLGQGEWRDLWGNPGEVLFDDPARVVYFIPQTSGGNASAALTGSCETLAHGTVSPAVTLSLSGNSLTNASGLLGSAIALNLSGSSESITAGTVSCSVQLDLSGNELSFAFGTVTVSTGYFATLAGLAQTFSLGSLTPEIKLALIGNVLNLSQGTVVVGAAYIVALTGLEQTFSPGTLSAEIELSINGQTQILAFGVFSPEIQTTLTGRSMSLTPGTLSIAGGSGDIVSLDPATIAAIAAAIWSDPRAPTIAKLLAIKDG